MLIVTASILISSMAVSPQVDVGRFDAERFPAAPMRERQLPYDELLPPIEDILRTGRCAIEGQSYRRFDIRIPYAVLLAPDGTAQRFIVRDIGCAPLETFAGHIMIDLARAGDFGPTGSAAPAWYVSELRFTVE